MGDNIFYDHLDQCERCRTQPFNLCVEGQRLIRMVIVGVAVTDERQSVAVTDERQRER